MVTTKFSFWYWGTTAMVARSARKAAKHLNKNNYELKLGEAKKSLELAFKRKQSDKVEENISKMLDLLGEQEKYLFSIEKNELILLHEEENNIRKEIEMDRDLKVLIEKVGRDKIQSLYDSFYKDVDAPLRKIADDLKVKADTIRRLTAFLKENNYEGINLIVTPRNAMTSIRKEQAIEGSMYGETSEEIPNILKEKKEFKAISAEFKKILKHLEKKELSVADKEFKSFAQHETEVFEAMKKNLDFINNVILEDTFLFAKTVHFLNVELQKYLDALEADEYPSTKLNDLKDKTEKLRSETRKNVNKVYALARYQERHARRAA